MGFRVWDLGSRNQSIVFQVVETGGGQRVRRLAGIGLMVEGLRLMAFGLGVSYFTLPMPHHRADHQRRGEADKSERGHVTPGAYVRHVH